MEWVLVAIGYLCGSVSSAVLVCRILKLPDPRAGGSGNPGATNVLRLGGKKAGAMTLAGDVLKGFLPVLLAQLLTFSPVVWAATAVAAFLGHLYPVFFNFKGGKGVATAFGVVAGLAWPVALFMGVIWLLVAFATRYASLASMAAVGAAPVFCLLFFPFGAQIGALVVVAGLLIWRHRDNIERLKAGNENEIEL